MSNMESLKTLWRKWKDGTLHETWEEWLFIWSYGKRYWPAILFYIFLGMFGTVFSLVSSIASKNLIDIVTGIQTDRMGTMIAIIVPMALFSMLFGSLCSRISLKISIRISNDIQADIFDKIINVRWLDLSRYTAGELLNRFGSDVSTVAGSAIGWFPQLINSLFSFVVTLMVVIYYDPTMGLLTVIQIPIMFVSSRFTLPKMRKYTEKVKEMNGKVLQFHQETFNNIDTIKSFDLTDQFGGKLRDWQQENKKINLEYNAFTLIRGIIMSVVGMIISYAAYFWGVYRLWTGAITYGEMTLFLGQGSKLAGQFKNVVSIIPSTITSTISARRLMEIINLPPDERLEAETEELKLNRRDGFTVEFNDITFGYQPDKPVIRHGNLCAHPGEIIGLVGPSGAGKTTSVRLLLGLVTPDEGTAQLRDQHGNVTKMNAATRTMYSYVPQGNTIFSGTIAENLRLADPDATDEELRHALETACAWEFVSQLPDGMDSVIGQRGQGLSEGQGQRIAIARAVLRKAPILLLDEATSALDVYTENRILENLLTEDSSRTCIVTTHRPSTLARCRRAYQISDGTIHQLTDEQRLQFGQVPLPTPTH